MIGRLLARFRRPAAPSAHAVAGGPSVRWMGLDDPANPFVVEGYDCLAFVRSMVSTTQDPAIAESFHLQRHADGANLAGLLPGDAVAADCALAYRSDGAPPDGPLFKAEAMEDKWDIYLHGDRIYFCRSWTGTVVHVAEFTVAGDTLAIHRTWSVGSADPGHATREIDYLVKSHVLGRRVPHPLPDTLAAQPHLVGLHSFSLYGRQCCFGTFADTLHDVVLKAG